MSDSPADPPSVPSVRDLFLVLGRRLAVPLRLPYENAAAVLESEPMRHDPRVELLWQIARRARRLKARSIDAALTPVALRIAMRAKGEKLPTTGALHAAVRARFGVPLDLQNDTFVTIPTPPADAPCIPAASALALEWLARIRSMEAESVLGIDPEGPHQLRVGVRRIRSVLRLLERQHATSELAMVVQRVRALGDLAGSVRDRDVVLERIATLPVPEVARERALRHIATRRAHAQKRLQHVLCAPGITASIEQAEAALKGLPTLPGEVVSLETGARDLLDRCFKQFVRQCSEGITDGEAYHALRRRIRRIRDCVEVFGPVLRNQDQAWRKRLQPVQTLLGDLNDIETAIRAVPESLVRAAPVREALQRQRHEVLAELAVPLALVVVMALKR